MKAFLLAAGQGTRISRLIEAVPKCTLPIAGTPLVRLIAEMLLASGIELVVCVGYQPECVYDALKGLPVKYYVNPFYKVTNSIASLWFARDELVGESLILNADVYFSKDILDLALCSKYDAGMMIDETRTHVGDYFFRTNESGCIEKYGKELPLSERSCEYVGIAKISDNFIGAFGERLDKLVNNQQYGLWWENVLYSFTDKGEQQIHTIDVGGRFWAEIDFFDDYERILVHIWKMRNENK
jgi:choline kinase